MPLQVHQDLVVHTYMCTAMVTSDPQRSMAKHIDLLMRGSQKDDVGTKVPDSAVKPLLICDVL